MNRSGYHFRAQFSLRWLFIIVTAVAICALIYRLSGPFETAVVAGCLAVLGIGFTQPILRSFWFRGLLLSAVTVAVWMVGVDYSEFREGCDYCSSHWWVAEYRLFHQPVRTRKGKDHFPRLKRIAEDLGAPCPHEYTRWHTLRLWGFVWPGPPWHCGTCCLYARDPYPPELQERVKALAARDPELGKQFRDRALLKHDRVFLQEFYEQVLPEPPTE